MLLHEKKKREEKAAADLAATDVRAKEAQRLKDVGMLFRSVTNSSRATKVAKALIGPCARVWKNEGRIEIGEQHPNGQKDILGTGNTWMGALLAVCADLTKEEVVELAGPEIRATLVADLKRPPVRG